MERLTVSASIGAMNPTLAKLTTLLAEEYILLKGVRRNITSLREELYIMKGLLEKLADKEDIDAQLNRWMKQVREMSYDIEDFIDKFMLNLGRDDAEQAGFIRRASRHVKMLTARHKLARQITELKERIREASERRSRYKIDDGLESNTSIRPVNIELDHRPALHAESDTLVGRGDLMGRLIEWLDVDSHKQRKVAAIFGMGGLGKTRLAMELYRGIGGKFGRRAFVSVVGRRPHIGMILGSILSQVTTTEVYANKGERDVQQLIDAIRAIFKDKRYFVIIDDLWGVAEWRIISCALSENGCGSRVLVTTRMAEVAHSCCQDDGSYMLFMKPLTEVDSRRLFVTRVKNNRPTELDENITRMILEKCRGLPLAINITAGLLATKSNRAEEWVHVRNSISSGVDEYWILPVLRVSYLDLPFRLRTCLLYLSIFPGDKTIDRELLVRRWIAEGFITSEHEGESYFTELINRSLIEPMDIQYTGQAHACKVHDIVRDFIIYKTDKENFVTIYPGNDGRFELQDNIRRLSLDCRDGEYTFEPTATTTSSVRSLAIFGSDNEMPNLASFTALRVLDMESTVELQENYLEQIGRLYLLKYLRLQTTTPIELPREIGKLQFLETLDLSGAHIRNLPSSVVQLKQLIYLLVNNVNLPDGIGKLQALQKLSKVKIDSSTLASSLYELGSLAALRLLGLKWCISDIYTDKKSYSDKLVSSLNKLIGSKLQYLYVESEDDCSLDFLWDSLSIPFCCLQEFRMNSKYHFPGIPKWVSSLVNLAFLEISIDPVGKEVLQILAQLPALVVLLLSTKSAYPEQELIIRNSGFRRLKQFDFTCLNSWAILMFEEGAVRNLEKLRFVFTAQGECVPNSFGIEHLVSLKHLVVEIKCGSVGARVVEAAEDAIRNAVNFHPNKPTFELIRKAEEHVEKEEMEISRPGEKMQISNKDKASLDEEGPSDMKHDIAAEHDIPVEHDIALEPDIPVEHDIAVEKISTLNN